MKRSTRKKQLQIWNVHRTGPQAYFAVLAGDHPEAYPAWTFVGSATARTEAEAITKVWTRFIDWTFTLAAPPPAADGASK